MYRLTNVAYKNLDDLFEFGVAQYGFLQAEKFYNLLLEDFQRISQYPKTGKYRVEINSYTVPRNPYVIIYKIVANKEVLIISVIRSKQDYLNYNF